MRGVHLKEESSNISTEKARVVASWLLYHDRYVRQYYSEHYNRDFQVYNLKN